MNEHEVHPLAVVEEGAKIGKRVRIEPFAMIKKNVILEDDVTVCSHAYLDGHTTIGRGTTIWPSASIGARTQDKKYQGETTYVEVGAHCEIREFVTINASVGEGSKVVIGDHCLIMAYCHIAHNCCVGHHVVMSNSVMLAGHVDVGDYTTIGGMTGVHQFTRIGCHSMVGGMSRVIRDVPPYSLGSGNLYIISGLNRIGVTRRGFPFDVRLALARAFRLLYHSDLSLEEALFQIETTLPAYEEVTHLVQFCRSSKRGLIGKEEPKQAATV